MVCEILDGKWCVRGCGASGCGEVRVLAPRVALVMRVWVRGSVCVCGVGELGLGLGVGLGACVCVFRLG